MDERRVQQLCMAWKKVESSLLQKRVLAASSSAAVSTGIPEANGGKRSLGHPNDPVRPRRPRRWRRLCLLLQRSWRQTVRDSWINGVRFGVSTGLALVFGEIFGRLGAPTAASVAERVARTQAMAGIEEKQTPARAAHPPKQSMHSLASSCSPSCAISELLHASTKPPPWQLSRSLRLPCP